MAQAKVSPRDNSTRVYSYIRFSRPEQMRGNSLRRQLELSKKWCERNGYILDESLKLHDLGISAFRGRNAAQGKLGAFLEAIKSGGVARGSILLLESLDRLTRTQVGDALELVLGILNKGITIVTLSPEETFTKESTNDVVKLLVMIIIMSRAYEESATKSRRVSDARERGRQRAREENRTLTRQMPSWIYIDEKEKNPGRQRKAHPAAVQAIRTLFKLKLKGWSLRSIEREMNENAAWQPPPVTKDPNATRRRGGNGWRGSYIRKILTNRAVIGECQFYKRVGEDRKRVPDKEPLTDYFPAIVPRGQFLEVQKLMERNRGKGGRTGEVKNILTHLVKCPYCGGSMIFEDKGKSPKGGTYLVCELGRRKARDLRGKLRCGSHRIRYSECESLVLENCPKLRPEQILPNPTEQVERCRELTESLNEMEREVEEIKGRQKNLTAELSKERKASTRELFVQQIEELEGTKDDFLAKIGQAAAELSRAQGDLESLTNWQNGLNDLRKALKSGKSEVRLATKMHLADFIDRIDVYASGHFEPYSRKEGPIEEEEVNEKGLVGTFVLAGRKVEVRGDNFFEKQKEFFSDVCPKMTRNKEFVAFLKDVAQRRRTREGRFICVRFKSGFAINLVPEGSIASGQMFKLSDEPDFPGQRYWSSIEPDLESLWKRFKIRGKTVAKAGVRT